MQNAFWIEREAMTGLVPDLRDTTTQAGIFECTNLTRIPSKLQQTPVCSRQRLFTTLATESRMSFSLRTTVSNDWLKVSMTPCPLSIGLTENRNRRTLESGPCFAKERPHLHTQENTHIIWCCLHSVSILRFTRWVLLFVVFLNPVRTGPQVSSCRVRKGTGSQSVVVCGGKYPAGKSQQWVL